MANRKKISELDIAQTISGDDLFVVVDPNTDTGNDSSSTGKTNKVTLNTIKNSMFPAGAPIQFWNQNSNNIFFNTGNVGIGTDSPTAPLTIVEKNNVALKILKSSGQTLFTIGEDGDNNVVLDSTTVDLSDNTSSKNLILKGGNVGIGTDTPTAKLDIQSSQTTGAHELRIRCDNTEFDKYSRLVINTGGGRSVGLQAFGNKYASTKMPLFHTPNSVALHTVSHQMTFDLVGPYVDKKISFIVSDEQAEDPYSADKAVMNITKSGVGIGTDNPKSPLDVTGNFLGNDAGDETSLAEIRGSRHRLLFREHRHEVSLSGNNWDGVTYKLQKRVDSTDMQSINFVHDSGARSVDNHIDLYVGGHTSLDPVLSTRFAGNGNVGIGTLNPKGNLHVHSDSSSGTNLYLTNGSDQSTNSDWRLQADDDGTFNLGVETSSFYKRMVMSVDGRIAIGGLTNVGTNTFEGDQIEMHPSAKFQINGYGTLPTTRNAGLFLNASTKGGHPAVLFGHNNAINWSVKSDPDAGHAFTILNHNFGFDENNIASPNMIGSETVLKITNGSEPSTGRPDDVGHAKFTFDSRSRISIQNPVVDNNVYRDPSFTFTNSIKESTLASGGLGYGYDNPTIARFSQLYNHVNNDSQNGDYLDINIYGKASDGHYGGMALSTGYGDLFLRARNIDLPADASHGGAQVQIRTDNGVNAYGDGANPSYIHTFSSHINSNRGTTIAAYAKRDDDVQISAGVGVYRNDATGGPGETAYWWMTRSQNTDGIYFYTDSNGTLRNSTSASNIGKQSGGVVGDQTSDERLKVIEDNFEYGLDSVMKLKPIAFKMKDDKNETRKLGFGAQTTQSIVPEAVYDSGDCLDGYDAEKVLNEDGEVDNSAMPKQTPKSDQTKLMMEYVQLMPVLTKAIQEQQQKINDLENMVSLLKDSYNHLSEENKKLKNQIKK